MPFHSPATHCSCKTIFIARYWPFFLRWPFISLSETFVQQQKIVLFDLMSVFVVFIDAVAAHDALALLLYFLHFYHFRLWTSRGRCRLFSFETFLLFSFKGFVILLYAGVGAQSLTTITNDILFSIYILYRRRPFLPMRNEIIIFFLFILLFVCCRVARECCQSFRSRLFFSRLFTDSLRS